MSTTELKTTLDINFDPAIQGSKNTEKTLNDLRGEIKALKDSLDQTAIESDDFKDKLNSLNAKQKELKEVTTLNVSESANLRKQFKQLKDELLLLEEGTEEYSSKLQQASDISQKLQDVNEFIKSGANDLGDHIENLTGAFAGMTGSIQIVQGAMQAMGVESEQVELAIAKLQGLMAITEGLKSIESAVDPFKRLTTSIKLATAGMSGFKKALIGTGIGAFVVAIGALIANWDRLTLAIQGSTKAQKEFNELQGKTILTQINLATSIIEGVKTEEEKLYEQIKTLTTARDTLQSFVEKFKGRILDRNELQQLKEIFKQLGVDIPKKQNEYLPVLISSINTLNNALDITQQKIKDLNDTENVVERTAKQIEGAPIQTPDIQPFNIPEVKPYLDVLDIKKKSEEAFTIWLAEEERKREQQRKESLENFKEYGTQVVLSSMASVANILDVINDGIDTSNKKGFEKSKQLRVATATIDMIGGIISSWMSAMQLPFPYNFIQAGINAATALTMGTIQINQIKQQQFEGGSTNIRPPQLSQSATNASNTNGPINYLKLNELANQTTKLPDTKVYVTETDIRNTMNKVTVTQSESHY